MSKKKSSNRKTGAIIGLCVLLVLTIVFGYLGFNGMPLDGRGLYRLLPWMPTTNAENWPESLALGLDLRGGVYVEYSAQQPDEIEGSFDALMDGTIAVIQQRLTDKGYPESTVQKINNGTGIRVEIPDVTDPQAVLDLIGTPAELSFRDPDGNEFMTGKQVQTASYFFADGDHQVAFTLTKDGAALFADMTAKSIGKQIAIYLDNEMLINPTVQSAIPNGSGVINGMGSEERARTIAAQIQSGALPLVLTQQKVDTVSATLGDEALSTSIRAAMIGILLVMLFMIVRYRMNGVVASWALCIYMLLLFFFIAVIPGIYQGNPDDPRPGDIEDAMVIATEIIKLREASTPGENALITSKDDDEDDTGAYKDFNSLQTRLHEDGLDIQNEASTYLTFQPDKFFEITIVGKSFGIVHKIVAIALVQDSKVRYLRWQEDP